MKPIPAGVILLCCLKAAVLAQSCNHATDFLSYSRCVTGMESLGKTAQCGLGMYSYGGVCFPLTANMCPPNSILTNGACSTQSQCPKFYNYINGVCVYPDLYSSPSTEMPISLEPKSCDSGMILHNGKCVPTLNIECPNTFTLQDGICVRQVTNVECGPGMVVINDTCEACPENSFVVNGLCGYCPEESHYYDGQCIKCPPFTTIEEGKCKCPEGKYYTNTGCETIDAIETEGDAPDEIVHNVTSVEPGHFTDIVTIHDLVNTTQISGDNNNIVATGDSASLVKEDCCVIIQPKKCILDGNQWKCFQRRFHACGQECLQASESIPNVSESEWDKRFKMDVAQLGPQPLEQPFLYQQQPVAMEQPQSYHEQQVNILQPDYILSSGCQLGCQMGCQLGC